MTENDFELVRGSGNVFRDFNDLHADLKQAKAILAARIIAVLDDRSLTVRKAANLTGFAAADFSRVCEYLKRTGIEEKQGQKVILPKILQFGPTWLDGLTPQIRASWQAKWYLIGRFCRSTLEFIEVFRSHPGNAGAVLVLRNVKMAEKERKSCKMVPDLRDLVPKPSQVSAARYIRY